MPGPGLGAKQTEEASWDLAPSEYPNIALPIHRFGIVGMGLWLIAAANFEPLAETCVQLNPRSSCSW